MGNDMPKKSNEHSKMDCCTPACQVTSSAALLPDSQVALVTDFSLKLNLTAAPVKELASAPSSGLDPPPRT